jgi:hypothetical protein
MRRVAAVRAAQRALAQGNLHAANRTVTEAGEALMAAAAKADAAFAAWRGQREDARFQPELERHYADRLIARTEDHAGANDQSAQAGRALGTARQQLHRAEAAVEQSGRIVTRLHRADLARREERRMADHADTVTRRWSQP